MCPVREEVKNGSLQRCEWVLSNQQGNHEELQKKGVERWKNSECGEIRSRRQMRLRIRLYECASVCMHLSCSPVVWTNLFTISLPPHYVKSEQTLAVMAAATTDNFTIMSLIFFSVGI